LSVSVAQSVGPPRQANWITFVAAARAWLFLAVLVVGFELWAQFADNTTFIGNVYNLARLRYSP
jgi:hypothetical protein